MKSLYHPNMSRIRGSKGNDFNNFFQLSFFSVHELLLRVMLMTTSRAFHTVPSPVDPLAPATFGLPVHHGVFECPPFPALNLMDAAILRSTG